MTRRAVQTDVATRLHQLGTGVGIACAIHCLLMPLVVGLVPLLGLGFMVGETAEIWIVGTAIPITIGSALWGFHRHRELRIVMTLFGAAGLLSIGVWLGHSNPIGTAMTVVGAVAIAGAHVWGARLCRSCPTDSAHGHDHGHEHEHQHEHDHDHSHSHSAEPHSH